MFGYLLLVIGCGALIGFGFVRIVKTVNNIKKITSGSASEELHEFALLTAEIEKAHLWRAKGITIVGYPDYIEPPIETDGAKMEIYQGKETVDIFISAEDLSLKIAIDYDELEGRFDFASVVNYLKRRNIIK